MLIKSTYFGDISIEDDKIIKFDTPIPGFSNSFRYFIITKYTEGNQEKGDETDALFCWLHSADDFDIAFALLDVFKVKADYKPEIDEEYLEQLSFEDNDSISVLNIVNIPENISDMTVNLLAPIVINFTKMRGMQIILSNDNYSLRHQIFKDIQKVSAKETDNEVK